MIWLLVLVFLGCHGSITQAPAPMPTPASTKDSVECLAGCRCQPGGQIAECPDIRPGPPPN